MCGSGGGRGFEAGQVLAAAGRVDKAPARWAPNSINLRRSLEASAMLVAG
jgi:hypothetical protein